MPTATDRTPYEQQARELDELLHVGPEVPLRTEQEWHEWRTDTLASALLAVAQKFTYPSTCRPTMPHLRPCGPVVPGDDSECACGCDAAEGWCYQYAIEERRVLEAQVAALREHCTTHVGNAHNAETHEECGALMCNGAPCPWDDTRATAEAHDARVAQEAAEKERAACARLCDERLAHSNSIVDEAAREHTPLDEVQEHRGRAYEAHWLATAIRSRGGKGEKTS